MAVAMSDSEEPEAFYPYILSLQPTEVVLY